jgi:RimJ/RimL family protein N-acetyltransferase
MLRYNDLLKGELVRLSAEEPDTIAECFNRWSRNSEYMRQLDTSPARLWSTNVLKEWLKKDLEKDLEKEPFYWFHIRTLDDDRVIGDIALDGVNWNNGESFVGISIGEKENWNKGYGTDAMRLIVRYAFAELNLRRVSLTVFEYNPRGLRSYQKAGFKEEGRMREYLNRDGRRWDMIFMGILREEWQSLVQV